MTGSRHPLAVIGRRAVIGGLVAGAALAQGTDPRGNAPRGDDPQAVIRTFLSALETTVRGGEARPFRQRFDQGRVKAPLNGFRHPCWGQQAPPSQGINAGQALFGDCRQIRK